MTGIITQCRTGSHRFPKKVLMEVDFKKMIEYHLERLMGKVNTDMLIVATTDEDEDDVIEFYCKNNGINCFRGSKDDLLDRYYNCAKKYSLDKIVRVTSDCPFIDAELINAGLKEYESLGNQRESTYYSNTISRTFAKGADFEIFSFKQLEYAFFNADILYDREHVTPFIIRNYEKYNLFNKMSNDNDIRLTLDYQEDFFFIRELIQKHDANNLQIIEIAKIIRENKYINHLHSKLMEFIQGVETNIYIY